MSSEFKITQCIVWCTALPSTDHPHESPVFLLEGNLWFFRFIFNGKYFSIFMELKKKNRNWKSYTVRFKIECIDKSNLDSLETIKSSFSVSECCKIKTFYPSDLCFSESPYDYMAGIKFKFYFDKASELLLKVDTENTGYISSDLQLSSSNFCLESLSRDFNKMLLDELDGDVEIKCDTHTWKVHKSILCARSKVLYAMLKTDMTEGRTGVITLREIDVATVQNFLKYLYSAELPEMTVEIAKQLYEMGDKYEVECLKKSCAYYLVSNLDLENALESLIFATKYSDSSFKESIINFIILKRIFMKDDLWCDFRKCHPSIAFEIYDRFCKDVCP